MTRLLAVGSDLRHHLDRSLLQWILWFLDPLLMYNI